MCRLGGAGVEFDSSPKLDFPPVKPEAFETAGCRVGRPGFRAVAFVGGRRGQLVICNGGMWGRLGGAEYSLSHCGKKKKKGRRRGKGRVELGLSLSLRRLRAGRRVPVAYFQFLETPDKLNLLKATLLTNAIRAPQSTRSLKSIMADLVN